jgi:hypothetical protein
LLPGGQCWRRRSRCSLEQPDLDAARLVAQAKPRQAIPCPFWTFAEQGAGDLAGFVHACRAICPEVQALLLKPGEGFTLHPARWRRPA